MTDPTAKPRRGCFFYGCISGLVLLVLILGALTAGLHVVKKAVNQWTDSQPMEVPTEQMPQAEMDKLKQRFDAFEEAVRAQRPTEPLILTADEINALIGSVPHKKRLEGKFHVSLEGDQIKGEMCVPLAEVGLTMFRGRYLNGSGTFSLAFSNGVLFVAPQAIIVKGKSLPEAYMKTLRRGNVAAGLTNAPATAAVLRGLEDIQVKEGKLVVVPKTKK